MYSKGNRIVRRLIDKLLVKCPPGADCGQTLHRGDLEDHLKFRLALQIFDSFYDFQPLSAVVGRH